MGVGDFCRLFLTEPGPGRTRKLLILFHAPLHLEMCQCATNQTQLTTRELELEVGESTATLLTSTRAEPGLESSPQSCLLCALRAVFIQLPGKKPVTLLSAWPPK